MPSKEEEEEAPDVPGVDVSKEIEVSPETKSKMASPEFIWSKSTYNMARLMSKYSDKFPIIVQVNKGYYGKFDMDTLASSQVARLHTWGLQERVLACNVRGKQISIPLDYQIEFEVIEKKGSKKKKLKQKKLRNIIKDHSLPVVVQFPRKEKWKFRIGSQKFYTQDFGALEIRKVYTQRFLKGNTIHNGVIDTKVMLVPMYVNVTFKVAIGAKGHTDEEWEALQNMYTRAVHHINFDQILGTKDMTEFPSEQQDKIDDILTDDELDEDGVDGPDANANLMSVSNKESTNPHVNGDVKPLLSGDHQYTTGSKGEVISIPIRQNITMQVAKKDLGHGNSLRSNPEPRSMLHSEFSDYSSYLSTDRSGFRKQNVVHVSLGDDAQVITQEMYDQDFSQAAPIIRHSNPATHGSTIINVTNDNAEIVSPHSQPVVFSATSQSESNLPLTFSDTDFHDNSVFFSNSVHQEEYPSYATRRRYKETYPSISSNDVSHSLQHGKKKYGQVLVGGAPLEERPYHSMKDLSGIDTQDSRVSRLDSFRSVAMTPSPTPGRPMNQNLYVQLRDNQPQERYIKRIEFYNENPANPVTYTRRVGVERATKTATQVKPRERNVNQGVYFTDGHQNYPVPKKRVPRPDPPSYNDVTSEFVEVIKEDFSHAEPSYYTQHKPMQSPVMSSSSQEDSKRHFVLYNNNSTEVPVMTETTENGEEFVYQGSMMLRKGRDFEQLSIGDDSMIEIPIEDIRSQRGRTVYSNTSNYDEYIPVHDAHTNHQASYVTRKVTHPVNSQRVESSSEVRRVAYDEVDADDEYDDGYQHADMTKGAAEHWGRLLDISTTSNTRHNVPIEFERSSAIVESMFDGGHHSHTFTGRDRSVCQRLERQRQERSNSHRELSLRRNIQERRAAGRSEQGGHRLHTRETTTSGINVRGPGVSTASTSAGFKAHAGASSSSHHFTTNRNEVWSGDSQTFGVAPLTTTEHEANAILQQVEKQLEDSSGGLDTSGVDMQEDMKGSTSSYSDSSLSSTSVGIDTGSGGHDIKRSYDLPSISVEDANTMPSVSVEDTNTEVVTQEVVVQETTISDSNDTAGPAANAAVAAMADGNLDIQGDQRISRKTARELTRSGSVRSLREVYARSRSPSSSQRDKPKMAVAPAAEVFSDILNKPTTSATNGVVEKSVTETVTTTTTSQDNNVILRNKTGRERTTAGRSLGDSSLGTGGDQDLAWQETQSYHLESIRDSIRDLDEYLKNQGGDTDSHSLSSANSSKHMEHFSYALSDPAIY